MRKCSSYGPINTKLHYYAPRTALIDRAYAQLFGDDPEEGGHYITVWAPRQTEKTWVMQQIVKQFQEDETFTMQPAKEETTDEGVSEILVANLREWFGRDFPDILSWKTLSTVFARLYFTKPLILILDEFDAIGEEFINDRLHRAWKAGATQTRKNTTRFPAPLVCLGSNTSSTYSSNSFRMMFARRGLIIPP
ncbi:hypothetical protein U27_05562 [Candidatus Vecturithrix granuli]|uniref:Uncharacterized protein n=1 Tax=Vecturithrix granuli TaxID=1499967 RepID=A0A081C1Y3_VECG1|nr:hypothetical protein U27_05562 [Candidatus Vecturithrix granuli]